MSAFQPAPRWLENCVIEGLQMLLTLRLRNAPAVDTIEAVIDVWLAVFMARSSWDEQRDVPRLRKAFMQVAGRLESWPAPAQIFDNMPAVPQQRLLKSNVQCTLPRETTQQIMSEAKAWLSKSTVKTPPRMSANEMNLKVQQKLKEKP